MSVKLKRSKMCKSRHYSNAYDFFLYDNEYKEILRAAGSLGNQCSALLVELTSQLNWVFINLWKCEDEIINLRTAIFLCVYSSFRSSNIYESHISSLSLNTYSKPFYWPAPSWLVSSIGRGQVQVWIFPGFLFAAANLRQLLRWSSLPLVCLIIIGVVML